MNFPYFEREQAKNIQIEIIAICKQHLFIPNDFEQIIADFLFGVMTCYKQEHTTYYCQPVQNYLALYDSDEFFSNALVLVKIPLLLNSFFNYLDNNQKLAYRFESFLYDIKKLINHMIYQHSAFKNEVFLGSWLTELETMTKQIMIEGTIHQLSFNQDYVNDIKRLLENISHINDLSSIDSYVNDVASIFNVGDLKNFIQTSEKLLKTPYEIEKYFKIGFEKDKGIYKQNNDLYISRYCLAKISYSFLSLIINHHYFRYVVVQEKLFETIANELSNNQHLFLGGLPKFPSSLIFIWLKILLELQKEENLSTNLFEYVQNKLPVEFKCTYFFESKSQYERYLKAKHILSYPLHEFYQYNLPFELLSKDGIAALWPLKIVNTMTKMAFDEQQVWQDLWKHCAVDRVYINNIPDSHWLNTAHEIHRRLASDCSQTINQWLLEILEDIPRKDKPFSQHNEKIVCSLLWFASFGETKVLSKTMTKYAKFFETSIKPYGSRSLPIAKVSNYCLKKWQVL